MLKLYCFPIFFTLEFINYIIMISLQIENINHPYILVYSSISAHYQMLSLYLTLNLIIILILISMETLKSIKHSTINFSADLQNPF